MAFVKQFQNLRDLPSLSRDCSEFTVVFILHFSLVMCKPTSNEDKITFKHIALIVGMAWLRNTFFTPVLL